MKRKNIYTNYRHKGKERSARQKPIRTVVGVIRGSSRGFAFLSCEQNEDIFIPAKSLKGAMHGDTVEVDVYPDHGEVRRIVANGTNELTGIFVMEMRTPKVIPDSKHYSRDIYVTGARAEIGDRVVVRLSRKDRGRGEIIKVLGKAGTLSSDIEAAIFKLGIEDFRQKVLDETHEAARKPITTDGRVDFTAQPCFTIDGESSKDFDDAVYAERTDGGFRLWVHIADVAHYVPNHSHTDKQAFRRGNSFYYGESVIPMLPEALCNGVCSLNENELRYTLTAIMDICTSGDIIGGEVVEGIICSHQRMTYERADKVLSGESNDYAQHKNTLLLLKELRDVLKKKRDSEGNIDFEIPEPKFEFHHGRVTNVSKSPRLLAHSIIEECMIAANRFVAKKFLALKAPFVYREHEPPSPERIDELNVFLEAMGIKGVKPSSSSIASLLDSVPQGKKAAVSRMTLRSMSKARYSVECGGHFGLAIKEYCHFTSPIRRYSDLAIHRVIKSYIRGESLAAYNKDVEEAAKQASERERLSEKIEREIDELYIADYMSQFVGKTFDGTVSGITEWGVYIELDNTAEGMIRAETMGNTQFNEATSTMSVLGKGVITLGDPLRVVLVSANSGNILFELA
ncbi:MAG: VacB/RNase II family 3'-5' exoribonuclease [Clostridia bacterium]|nr:VacB/RNase II family 3'-5' exoribonuclease [Clostridia bacterium]